MERHHLAGHVLLSAEGQDAAYQVSSTLAGLVDLCQVALHRSIRRHGQDSELGIAHDGGQYVVEVVRDAARERAQGFHLLGLT